MSSELPRAAALILLLAPCCVREVVPATADGTVRFACHELAARGDPGIVWDLLPATWQREIDGWVHTLGARVPGGLYDKSFRLVHALGVLLKSRAEDLATAAPLFVATSFAGSGAREEDRIALLTAMGNIWILLARSELAKQSSLGKLDVGRFLHETGSELWPQLERLYRITGRDLRAVLDGVEAVARSSEGPRIHVAVTIAGESSVVPFVEIEGRWIPAAMADGFATRRPRVAKWLASLGQADEPQRWIALDVELDRVLADVERLSAVEGRGALLRELEGVTAQWSKRWRVASGR